MENVEKWIEETWFQEHKATLTQQGDLQILDWQKPGTGTYYCRYIFEGSKVYISGDIGEAVFRLNWKADIHSFDKIHIHYFEEKLSAYSGERRNYNGDKAARRLLEYKEELIIDEADFDFDNSEFQDLVEAAKYSGSKAEWAHSYVNDQYQSIVNDLDSDAWEWIYDIGDEIPKRIYGYLVGLQMASKQLKENAAAVK